MIFSGNLTQKINKKIKRPHPPFGHPLQRERESGNSNYKALRERGFIYSPLSGKYFSESECKLIIFSMFVELKNIDT